MKTISILGSTGSIGTQTLEVAEEQKDIKVAALAAGNNIELLEKQIRKFRPALAAVWNEEKAKELKENVRDQMCIRDSRYTKNFLVTLILLPVIVQIIIMMVNGNLGTGVAVMGAFSLVRFRSMPGNSREITSIFLAMAIGLATGMGYLRCV